MPYSVNTLPGAFLQLPLDFYHSCFALRNSVERFAEADIDREAEMFAVVGRGVLRGRFNGFLDRIGLDDEKGAGLRRRVDGPRSPPEPLGRLCPPEPC